MKRRVRIYKAGGEHSADLTRAQQGMEMQPAQEQAPAPTAQDVMTYMLQVISQGSTLDEATQAVVSQGIPMDQATMIANQIDEYVKQQADANMAQETDDEDSAEKLAMQQEAEEAAAAEEEARAARMQQMYTQNESDYTGSTEDDSDLYMKLGGVKSKRDYIKNYMSLAKKQMGGGTEQVKPDLRTDVPINGRTEHLQKFLGAVKSTAQTAALKKQAEEAYNQEMQAMAQEGGMYPNADEDPENPMHHLGLYSQGLNQVFDNDMITQAQFGGGLFNGRGQQRRAMRRMNRMFPVGMVPQGAMFPQGFNINNLNAFIPQSGLPNGQSTATPQGFGGYGLANIDVRRTGLFGRPKEYTINFNTAAPVQPKEAEDLIEQATTNAEATAKEEAETAKAAETNTSSTTNAKVQEEAAKTADVQTADGVTAEVKAKDKSNTGKAKPVEKIKEIIEEEIIPVGSPVKNTSNTKVGPYNFSGVADAGKAFGQAYLDNQKAAKVAKWKEYQRQQKIDALPWLEKQMWYAEHPEDKPSVKSNAKPKTTSNKTKAKNLVGDMMNPIAEIPSWLFSPSDSGGGDNIGYQVGGFTDPESGLYKFFAGGEDPSIPQLSQADIDYMHSKNTTDPYFAYGGYFQDGGDNTPVDILDAKGNVVRRGTQAEAERAGLNHRLVEEEDNQTTNEDVTTETNTNPYIQQYNNRYNQYPAMYPRAYGAGRAIQRAGSWDKQKGSPYMTGTNNPYMGQLGPGSAISSIDVKRSGMFGAPKKYTINYSVPGQAGINANKTQSYKGSDGQMHFMNNANANQQAPGTADGRESRLKSMYRRMTEKGFSTPEESGSTGLHDKNDEKYKKIYGHYPGEQANGRPELPEMGKLATKPLEEATPLNNQVIRNQADLNPEMYNNLPNMQTKGQGMLNLPEIQNERVAQTFPSANPQQAPENLSPVVNTAGPRAGMEDYTGFGDYQNPVMPEADYMQDSLQIQGNPYNFGMDTAPNEEEMAAYLQNNLMPGVPGFEYPAYPHFNDAGQYINMPKEVYNSRPTRRSYNVNPVNTSPSRNTNPINTNTFSKKENKEAEGQAYNQLLDMRNQASGDDPATFRKSAQKIDATGKRMFRNMSNSQKLDYLKKLKKLDLNQYNSYLTLLQDGGSLPQAQKLGEFNYSGNDIPFGYFKDPTTGLIKNLAGDIYKPTTNLQGNADKLMNTNDLVSQGNGLTTDKSMGFDASGEQYRNDGLLSDAEKEAQARQNVSVDVKRKNMWDVNGPLLNDKINRGVNFASGILEKLNAAKANKGMYDRYNADELYAVNQDKDRGTYDINSGLFRPDEMGFTGVAALGGYMQEGGASYEEGGDTYMSEEEIQQFLADGGELEFI